MNRINKKRLLCALLTGALALPAVAWAQGQARPKPKAPAKVEEPQEEYTEEEYDAYEKAKGETDIDKRQTALIAFLEKYPQSKLKPYIVSEYQILFFEYQKKKDFEKLAAAAERWLKFAPNDLTAIAFIADAAEKLGQDRKFIEYAQKIYAQKPTGDMALMLAQSCRKLGRRRNTWSGSRRRCLTPNMRIGLICAWRAWSSWTSAPRKRTLPKPPSMPS